MAENISEPGIEERSVYDRIGFGGLWRIVWSSTPTRLKFVVPYRLIVYRDIFNSTYSLEDVLFQQYRRRSWPLFFKPSGPRNNIVENLLRDEYGIK